MSGVFARFFSLLNPTSSFQAEVNVSQRVNSNLGLELENWEREGVVVDTIAPGKNGRVQVFSTFWSARSQDPNTMLYRGDRVTVIARQGLLLLVELLEPTSPIRNAKRFSWSRR